MTNRVLSHPRQLRKLPIGAMLVNGSTGREWVFKKTLLGKWMLYDVENDDLNPHYVLTSKHPEWDASLGFDSLDLPAYLLSKNGSRQEALQYLQEWRRTKSGGPKHD